MKKLFVFIFFVLFSILPVFADSKEFGFRGPLNYFQSKVLEKIISTEVKKVVGGNITTDIRSYGAKALRNGIFKFARIKGKNLEFSGVHISEVEAYTVTENNRLDISDKSVPKLLTDIQGEYNAKISNQDLGTILNSSICNREIDKLNHKLAPFVSIQDVSVFAQASRLHFRLNLCSGLFGTEIPISGSAKIYTSNGVTTLDDVKLSKKIKLGLYDNAIALLNSLNPINIAIKALDDARLGLTVDEIKIIDDKIEIFGIIKVCRGV